jgi:hypothetical protein
LPGRRSSATIKKHRNSKLKYDTFPSNDIPVKNPHAPWRTMKHENRL